jgi:hypothetical protein
MRLRIADFIIQINQASSHPIYLDEGYLPFEVENDGTEPDLIVNAFGELPKVQIPKGVLLYRAQMPEGELWNVSKEGDVFIFNVFESESLGTLQQVCTTDSQFREWNVYMISCNTPESGIEPLKYPLGPLLMYYLTVHHEAIMIHASGISDNGIGRIFTGVSGKGKSTMARIWFEEGADVLNDDRLIIRKEKEGYTIHNTPMFYADRPRSSEFKSAYIIRHEPENVLEKLSGATAVSALAANCIQHGYDRKMVEHHLSFLSDMVNEVPVYSVGFVPNSSIVSSVRAYDA